MTDLYNPRAVIGGNNPPPYDRDEIAAFQVKVKDWAYAAGEWLDKKEIASEEEAEDVTDFVSGARAIAAKIEKARKAAVAPHLAAQRDTNAAYDKPAAIIDAAIKKMKALQEKWLKAKKAAAERLAAERALAAKRAAEDAEAAARAAAARNDIAGEVEAEEARAAAEKDLAAAAKPAEVKASSASGGGRTMSLRTRRTVRILNPRQAFLAVQDDDRVTEALQAALNSRVRAATYDGRPIPGCEIITEEFAV